MEGEEKMTNEIFEKFDELSNEAFEQYLYAIGISIKNLNGQLEEVD